MLVLCTKVVVLGFITTQSVVNFVVVASCIRDVGHIPSHAFRLVVVLGLLREGSVARWSKGRVSIVFSSRGVDRDAAPVAPGRQREHVEHTLVGRVVSVTTHGGGEEKSRGG